MWRIIVLEMDIVFEKGSKDEAKGHALLYFKSSAEPDAVWATYLVILPINVDVSKYVPPFLMNQMGELGTKDLSAFAFPPAPEKLPTLDALLKMADARHDDVLYGGIVNMSDISISMMATNEAVQQYAGMCSHVVGAAESATPEDDGADEGFGVNEVLYGLMSDSDRLTELTKLVGRLRFAVEGSEDSLIQESEGEIKLLAGHLPENHNISRLVEAVKSSADRDARLADLYLQRCFHLTHEAYGKLGEVEAEIRSIEDEKPPS